MAALGETTDYSFAPGGAGFPFVLAAVHTEWNEEDSRAWMRRVEAMRARKTRWFAAGRAPSRANCSTWNYDLVVFVDGETANGDGGGVTYAGLFSRFMSGDGWDQVLPNGEVRHVAPLAPAFAEKAKKDLHDAARRTMKAVLPSLLHAGRRGGGEVRRALDECGKTVVCQLRNLVEGGISPLYSRELSPATIAKRRRNGISSNAPLYATGRMVEHLHYAVKGKERAGRNAKVCGEGISASDGREASELVSSENGGPSAAYVGRRIAGNGGVLSAGAGRNVSAAVDDFIEWFVKTVRGAVGGGGEGTSSASAWRVFTPPVGKVSDFVRRFR